MFRTSINFAFCLMLPSWPSVLQGQTNDYIFAQPVKLTVGREVLDVGLEGGAAPFLHDFDSDGTNDLLLGESYGSRLRIYPGILNTTVAFNEFTLFDDHSPDARVPEYYGFIPIVVDLDQDGLDDIVTPSWHGNVSWYRKVAPLTYSGRKLIQNERGMEIEIEWTYSVAAMDWNFDGKVDLLVTASEDQSGHQLFVLINASEDGNLQFQNARPVDILQETPLEDLRRLHLATFDWNKDGASDLVFSNGKKMVYLFINRGEGEFERPIEVQAVPKDHPMDGFFHFSITDIRNDGVPDFLIAEEGQQFKATLSPDQSQQLDATIESYQAALASWGGMFHTYTRLRQLGAEPKLLAEALNQLQKVNQRQMSLKEKITEMNLEDQRHSYVWLIQGR